MEQLDIDCDQFKELIKNLTSIRLDGTRLAFYSNFVFFLPILTSKRGYAFLQFGTIPDVSLDLNENKEIATLGQHYHEAFTHVRLVNLAMDIEWYDGPDHTEVLPLIMESMKRHMKEKLSFELEKRHIRLTNASRMTQEGRHKHSFHLNLHGAPMFLNMAHCYMIVNPIREDLAKVYKGLTIIDMTMFERIAGSRITLRAVGAYPDGSQSGQLVPVDPFTYEPLVAPTWREYLITYCSSTHVFPGGDLVIPRERMKRNAVLDETKDTILPQKELEVLDILLSSLDITYFEDHTKRMNIMWELYNFNNSDETFKLFDKYYKRISTYARHDARDEWNQCKRYPSKSLKKILGYLKESNKIEDYQSIIDRLKYARSSVIWDVDPKPPQVVVSQFLRPTV